LSFWWSSIVSPETAAARQLEDAHHHGGFMKIEKLEREFRYNGGLRLPDPNPKLAVEEVINLYSNTYPEITTAAIEGPEVIGNKLVYRLTRAIGTKG
jgi:PRTRC genetic system protein C